MLYVIENAFDSTSIKDFAAKNFVPKKLEILKITQFLPNPKSTYSFK